MNIFRFPHASYISETGSEVFELYYIGESTKTLTKGKKYEIRSAFFSPDKNIRRKKVTITTDDNEEIIQINKNDFVDLSKLRELKIKGILE